MKFFIARLCGLCFLFFGLAASANTTTNNYWDLSSVQSVLSDLNAINQYTHGTEISLQTIEGYLHGSGGVQEELNWIFNSLYRTEIHASDTKGYLYQILSKLNSWQRTQDSYLTNILYAINSQTGSGSGFSDILAGNPWWATNSVFARTYSTASRVIPTVSGNDLMSFPELMSFWSAQLLPFSGSGRVNVVTPSAGDYWLNMWGQNRQNSGNAWQGRSFSWFDWMSEVQKTNLAWQVQVLSVLRGMTNSPAVAFDDILAGNPYWSTNSQFSPDWNLWGNQSPHPRGTPASFPEAFSLFLSSRLRMYHPELSPSGYFDSWGIDGDNTTGADNWQVYSFEDWLADYLKSNMVLTTSTSISNLNEELASTDYEEAQAPTNTPLPGYVDLISEADTSAGVSAIETGQTRVLNQVEALSGMLDSATPSSEIVVIPEMTVGGIHVSEYRAQLATSITPVAHRIMFFLWYVALYSSLFSLAQGEFAFYASLGRHWSISHGALTERNN